jgi:hypothetical protein
VDNPSEKFSYADEVSHGWFIDSFKRAHHKAEESEGQLNTVLTSRHIQMIAIGGTIFNNMYSYRCLNLLYNIAPSPLYSLMIEGFR